MGFIEELDIIFENEGGFLAYPPMTKEYADIMSEIFVKHQNVFRRVLNNRNQSILKQKETQGGKSLGDDFISFINKISGANVGSYDDWFKWVFNGIYRKIKSLELDFGSFDYIMKTLNLPKFFDSPEHQNLTQTKAQTEPQTRPQTRPGLLSPEELEAGRKRVKATRIK